MFQSNVKRILNTGEMREILKIGHLVKAIAHASAIAFAKWSVWIKN